MTSGRRLAGSIVTACAILASGCSGSSDTDADAVSSQSTAMESTATEPPATEPPATEPESSEAVGDSARAESDCVAPDGAVELRDQDFSDHQVPWERNGEDEVAIYVEAGNVSLEYRGYLEQGAAAWNKSPCLDVRVVDECPAGANCVTVSLTPGDDADGNFDSVEEGDFTIGGHIDLYYEELDAQGDGAKLNVTIHEMGHAVGLRHRETERVLMNGDTYTDIFDPDETDYYNLLVLYGNQQ